MSETPVIGFVAYSGTGKTTLLEKLIPLLRAKGLRIALLKHAHHDFDIDIPGKDSYRLRHAGASQVLVASARRWALIHENEPLQNEPVLGELLTRLDHGATDLVLVEGFKHEHYPKLALFRGEQGPAAEFLDDPDLIALVGDRQIENCPLPCLSIDAPAQIAEFLLEWMENQHRQRH